MPLVMPPMTLPVSPIPEFPVGNKSRNQAEMLKL
jgi:hypothetical protein